MAVKVSVPYSKEIQVPKDPEACFQFLSDFDKSVRKLFPGLEKLTELEPDRHHWEFEKFGQGGYDINLTLTTKARKDANAKTLQFESSPQPKDSAFLQAKWSVTPRPSGSTLRFDGSLELELPVPSLLKAMAAPVAQSGIRKILDNYLSDVEKALTV